MPVSLAHEAVVDKWNKTIAGGSDKLYPSLDLVRLEKWFFGGKPGRLLEYGFGTGVNLIHMLTCGYDADAVDASIEAKKLTEKKLAALPDLPGRANLHLVTPQDFELPFADDTFDYLTCINVLSLIGSREAVEALLGELARVVKPEAKAIFDVNAPNADFARNMEHTGDDMYVYRDDSGDGVPTWCPNEERFAEIIGNHFAIDDIGYSAHKYMRSEITEHIICGHGK